jgi:hypothetical protein
VQHEKCHIGEGSYFAPSTRLHIHYLSLALIDPRLRVGFTYMACSLNRDGLWWQVVRYVVRELKSALYVELMELLRP